jgi:4-hydroxybenzoate polyprenyltransferase
MQISKFEAMALSVALAAIVVLVAPMLTLWALNTLFPSLAIPITFETWTAVIILLGVGKASVTK